MITGLLLSLLLVAQGDTAAITRYVQTEMERQHIPGLSLAVLKGDHVLLSRGYGFANVELHVPVSDSTVYQSRSMGGFSYLGSPIVYVCHARSARASGGTLVSVFYTADWRAAGVEGYGY